ncbi:hypothetical protein D9613_004056 [Agrocybe pediades]|uniref:Uncharacterized protein n=1 Tax=Agrocybe pediades TaxID=84607 RepID=A0A8H4QJW3_9AGAR|nr:hypothetical protein D9613_004056 [Agrocybe pediades]
MAQELVEQKVANTPVPENTVTTVTLTVDKPKEVNLQTLAELTEAALNVLAPLCQQDKLSEKALVYVGAIDSSINAAQYGYDVCEDVIRMAELIKDNAAEAELSKFAENVLLQAQNAHERVKGTLEKFRDVRVQLQTLINETRSQEDKNPHTEDELDRLEKSIHIFESLQENVDQYASWWSWMNLATNSQVQSAIMYQVNHTSMRKKANLRVWRNTKASFLDYTRKIKKVQNHHDEIFQLAATNSFSTATTIDPDFLNKQLSLSDERKQSISPDDASSSCFFRALQSIFCFWK